MAQSPAMTFNTTGDILASSTITASNTSTSAVAAQTKFEVQLQVAVTFGTVAGTSGLQVDVYRRFGAGPTDDTISIMPFTIPSTASTTKTQSFALPTGKYDVKLTNLDATNSVTSVSITSSTVDSIG